MSASHSTFTQSIVSSSHTNSTRSRRQHAQSPSSSSSIRSRQLKEKEALPPLPDKPPPVPPKTHKPVVSEPTPARSSDLKRSLPVSQPKRSFSLRSLSLAYLPLLNASKSEKGREREQLEEALKLAVTNSGIPSTVLVGETSLLVCTTDAKYSWLSHLFSKEALEKLFVSGHAGNYVVIRATGVQIFEEMPIYARIGMHLLFYGSWQIRLLHWSRLRNLLKEQSIRQGKIYDSTDPDLVRTQIAAFVDTYRIDLSELLQPDLTEYKTFNDFFSRKLRPGARAPASPFDHSVVVSAADCRLTVWPTWDSARRLWVKGRKFTIANLLQSRFLTKSLGHNPSLAIFRLAPQDYHRFHSPLSGTVTSIRHIHGDYYTVNPQAINQRLDVLTANVRSVCTLRAEVASSNDANVTREVTVAIIAVGALLVGSIGWAKNEGEKVEKGEELGWFRYGGSTVVVVMPEGVFWDMDLMKCSADGLEVLVKAGEQIGRIGVR